MTEYTDNYGLSKYSDGDAANLRDQYNASMDIIDNQMKTNDDSAKYAKPILDAAGLTDATVAAASKTRWDGAAALASTNEEDVAAIDANLNALHANSTEDATNLYDNIVRDKPILDAAGLTDVDSAKEVSEKINYASSNVNLPFKDIETVAGNGNPLMSDNALVVNRIPYGNGNTAIALEAAINREDNGAPITGTDNDGIFDYNSIDAVAFVTWAKLVSNAGTDQCSVSGLSVTANTPIPSSIKAGSYVMLSTSETSQPAKVSDFNFIGKITAIIGENSFTVDNWGAKTSGTAPSGVYNITYNPFFKVWGQNIVVQTPDGTTGASCGIEVNIYNQTDIHDDNGGVDVTANDNRTNYAFRARGLTNCFDYGVNLINANTAFNLYGAPGFFETILHSSRKDIGESNPNEFYQNWNGAISRLSFYNGPSGVNLPDGGKSRIVVSNGETVDFSTGRLDSTIYIITPTADTGSFKVSAPSISVLDDGGSAYHTLTYSHTRGVRMMAMFFWADGVLFEIAHAGCTVSKE